MNLERNRNLVTMKFQTVRHLVIALVTLLTFVGCCYKVDCGQENLNFGLVSVSQADMDTIIFRKYEANSNFQSLKDTMQVTDINELFPSISGDTILFLISYYYSVNIKFPIIAGNDYEIFIPGTNKLTRITDIIEQKTKRKHCDISDGNNYCFNPIISFKVDGQIKSTEPFFIHK
ncbi:hypothetical protein BH11BAC3_BH11BAC3_06850 [soil metagenome]